VTRFYIGDNMLPQKRENGKSWIAGKRARKTGAEGATASELGLPDCLTVALPSRAQKQNVFTLKDKTRDSPPNQHTQLSVAPHGMGAKNSPPSFAALPAFRSSVWTTNIETFAAAVCTFWSLQLSGWCCSGLVRGGWDVGDSAVGWLMGRWALGGGVVVQVVLGKLLSLSSSSWHCIDRRLV